MFGYLVHAAKDFLIKINPIVALEELYRGDMVYTQRSRTALNAMFA